MGIAQNNQQDLKWSQMKSNGVKWSSAKIAERKSLAV